jgi:hypothetical protein
MQHLARQREEEKQVPRRFARRNASLLWLLEIEMANWAEIQSLKPKT